MHVLSVLLPYHGDRHWDVSQVTPSLHTDISISPSHIKASSRVRLPTPTHCASVSNAERHRVPRQVTRHRLNTSRTPTAVVRYCDTRMRDDKDRLACARTQLQCRSARQHTRQPCRHHRDASQWPASAALSPNPHRDSPHYTSPDVPKRVLRYDMGHE